MVNNSINIIKTKESLNSDGQQFHQYHQNKRKFKHETKDNLNNMVNNSINIIKTKESFIKTKESLNSEQFQQFHQYHQNKRKFKQ